MASVEVRTVSILLGFFLTYLALAGASNYAGQEKASESVVVVGKVFCDTCLEHRHSEKGYVISGASIALQCGLNRKTMTLSVMGETNENGEFKIEIPSNILQSAHQLNNCRVSPQNSPLDSCRIPSTSAPSKLTLQSDSNGILTYSAGSLSYRHEIVPPSCYREDFFTEMKGRAMAQNVDQSSKSSQETPTIQASLPKFRPAILPIILPPLPSFNIPPLPTIPLPKKPLLPNFGFPPLPNIPQLPTIPPLPKIPNLPTIPPLPQLSFPPFPKPSIPGFPSIPDVPPFSETPNFPISPSPFLTPPPSSQ